MFKFIKRYWILFAFLPIFLIGCVSYYRLNRDFNQAFESANLEKAKKVYTSKKKFGKGKNRLLYYLNLGTVNTLLGNYQQSNQYFEKAYLYIEDFRKNYWQEGVSLISNPAIKSYLPELHEAYIMHFYKGYNYLKLNQNSSARVEARRINIKLDALTDKFKSDKKFDQDAFGHLFTGIIYEQNREFNNAYISYKNALKIYEEVYAPEFGTNAPQQLINDIIRTGLKSGFTNEVEKLSKRHNIDLKKVEKTQTQELVFFWLNGLSPVKQQESINFMVNNRGGQAVFINEKLGLNFSFPVSSNDANSLSSLKIIRVAYPKYLERKPVFTNAYLKIDGKKYPVEEAENITEIAKISLKQRMVKELSNSLLRLALKKAVEYAARQENEGVGTAIGILNALTERADTRNWQTLPHTINYARIPLKQGENKLLLEVSGPNGTRQQNFTFNAQQGETLYHLYQQFDAHPAGY